ncbi:MAG: hypothetical protein ACRCZS_06650 [Chroococcidiopsis sp.]
MAQNTELTGHTHQKKPSDVCGGGLPHKARASILVILRRAYLDITGNHCAAKLIEYFHHWRKWKLKNHRTDWIYMPLRQIYEDLMREHSVNAIRGAIANLIKSGFLKQRHNPRNGQDRTYQYQLQTEHLEFKLASSGSSISKVPSVSSDKTSTQDPERISEPQQTQPSVVVSSLRSEHQEIIEPYPVRPEPPVKQVKVQPTDIDHQPIISDGRIKEVEALGVKLKSQSLRCEVINAAAVVYNNAIAVLKEKLAEKKVKNPPGFLRQALIDAYDIAPPLSRREEEFEDAYSQLKAAGIVKDVPTRHLNVRSNEILVCVIDDSDRGYYWLPWREAMSML